MWIILKMWTDELCINSRCVDECIYYHYTRATYILIKPTGVQSTTYTTLKQKGKRILIRLRKRQCYSNHK